MQNSNELWHDPVWQAIGVIVAIIFGLATLLLSLFTAYLVRRKKALTYDILSLTPLATVNDNLEGRLQILFDGRSVSNVQLALIRFTNSGNVPVSSDDYERPISIQVDDNARILSAGVTKTVPKSINPTIKFDKTCVTIAPVLLNKGDSITIKLLVANFEGNISVIGRVVGIDDIKELKLIDVRLNRMTLVIASSFLFLSTLIYVLIVNLNMHNPFVNGLFVGMWFAQFVFIVLAIFKIVPKVMKRMLRVPG